jgi:hypothetical protein
MEKSQTRVKLVTLRYPLLMRSWSLAVGWSLGGASRILAGSERFAHAMALISDGTTVVIAGLPLQGIGCTTGGCVRPAYHIMHCA